MYIDLLAKLELLEEYSVHVKKKKIEHFKQHQHPKGDPNCEKCKEIKAYLIEHFGENVV